MPPPGWDAAERVEHGRALFAEHCVLCHGERGDGRGMRRGSLSTAPVDLTNPVWRARQSPSGVFETIRYGVPGSDMPAWKRLEDREVWALTAYLLGLARTAGGGRGGS